MHIILNHSSMIPIYEQLMEQIKSEIIGAALKEGEALPSVRTLAGRAAKGNLCVRFGQTACHRGAQTGGGGRLR